MRVVLLILLGFTFGVFPAMSQGKGNRVSVDAYFELFGPAGDYSINLNFRHVSSFGMRFGGKGLLSHMGRCYECQIQPPADRALLFLWSINYYQGYGSHEFEVGLGARAIPVIDHNLDGIFGNERFSVMATLAYRYTPFDTGPYFRLSLNPVFASRGVKPYVGFGVGMPLTGR